MEDESILLVNKLLLSILENTSVASSNIIKYLLILHSGWYFEVIEIRLRNFRFRNTFLPSKTFNFFHGQVRHKQFFKEIFPLVKDSPPFPITFVFTKNILLNDIVIFLRIKTVEKGVLVGTSLIISTTLGTLLYIPKMYLPLKSMIVPFVIMISSFGMVEMDCQSY
ncbi:hypothetical protein U3516DRAFT_757359 [Neocallimastix sp. 'constans']